MIDVLDKEMFNYFIRLNDDEKKSVVEMLKTFLKGKDEKLSRIDLEQYKGKLTRLWRR